MATSFNDFFSVNQQKREIDATLIENALVDLLVRSTDEQVKSFGMNKGIMHLVDLNIQEQVLSKLKGITPETELGGSAANVARGLATLGCKISYSSTIGQDKLGQMFTKRLDDLKIIDRLVKTDSAPTGTSLVVVTPDGERTMNTHLGACRSYQKSDIPFEDILKSKIFFSTGYMLDTQNQIEAIHAAIDFALLNDVKVAFDIADPFVVSRHGRETLLKLLEKVQLVFANSEEAKMLVDCQGKEAAIKLAQYVQIAVVKDGGRGVYIGYDEHVIFVPAQTIEVTDTTGAGDMFAAGFMYGLCVGHSLKTCGRIAHELAADTIGYLGVRLSSDILKRITALS